MTTTELIAALRANVSSLDGNFHTTECAESFRADPSINLCVNDCIWNRLTTTIELMGLAAERLKGPFLLFTGTHYYPGGGANDLVGQYLSLDNAKAALEPLLKKFATWEAWLTRQNDDKPDYAQRIDWAHIIETDACETVNRWDWNHEEYTDHDGVFHARWELVTE
jgi:hypothetical protein